MKKIFKVEQIHFESWMHDFDTAFCIVVTTTWQRAKGLAIKKYGWDKNNVKVTEIDLSIEKVF